MKKIIFPVKAYLARRNYSRVQHYRVTLSCAFTGRALRSNVFLLPSPLSTKYQKLTSDISYSPTNLSYQAAACEENTYYLIANDLQNNSGSFLISQSYTVSVEPRKIKISKGFSLGEYHAIDLPQQYLQSNQLINIQDDNIQQLVEPILQRYTAVMDITTALYELVLKTLTYGNPIRGLYSPQQALQKRCVDCGGFSSLLIALYRACGIPARLVAGYWAGYKNNDMHAWMEFMLPDGTWIPIDGSTDYLRRQQRTYKTGEFSFVGSDRIVYSTGLNHTVEINGAELSLDILQTPISIDMDNKVLYSDSFSFATEKI